MTKRTGHRPVAPPPVRADARRNRDAVLTAAVRVLSDRPEASMREIATASGVGRTTVYRHFPQRADLVGALYRRVFDEAQAIATRAVDAGRAAWDGALPGAATLPPLLQPSAAGDALEVLAALTVEFAELGERYRFLGVQREHGQAAFESLAAEYGDEPLASYVSDAQARGQLREDLTVRWILDVVHGLTMMGAQHVRTGAGTAAELRRMLAATVRSALGPDRTGGTLSGRSG